MLDDLIAHPAFSLAIFRFCSVFTHRSLPMEAQLVVSKLLFMDSHIGLKDIYELVFTPDMPSRFAIKALLYQQHLKFYACYVEGIQVASGTGVQSLAQPDVFNLSKGLILQSCDSIQRK